MKRFKKTVILGLVVIFCSLLFSNCATELGTVVLNSEYVYPNSNVKPLGRTSGEWKKTTFLIPPALTKQAADEVINNALSKHESADVILDYDYVVTLITYPFWFYTLKLNIVGTAADMEVGKQNIGGGK
ncbi:MAG: hypothetical protein AAF363_10360 [Bacteroidota bacterium]